MEIKSTKIIVDTIQKSDFDKALKTLIDYGNIRETSGINNGWDRCRRLMRATFRCRSKRLKDSIVDYDDFQSMISLLSFTEYFSSIEDLLRIFYLEGSMDVKKCVSDINDLMYQKLGDLRIDRRIMPPKDQQGSH